MASLEKANRARNVRIDVIVDVVEDIVKARDGRR